MSEVKESKYVDEGTPPTKLKFIFDLVIVLLLVAMFIYGATH